MPPVFIPFDGWAPSASYFGEGWSSTFNLMPVFNTARPMRAFSTLNNTVAFGPMNGGHVHLWPSGTGTASYLPDAATVFAGSKTRIHTVNPSTGAFTDVSRAANYAAAGEPAGWRGATVGNDPWMTNWLDPMQRRVANAGLFTNGVVSAFAPVARHLAVVREHLVVANLRNAGRFVDEIAWSDADDATNFDPPTGTSISIAGSKRLISIPGQITGLLGGQYGLAFKRNGIFYLEATGTTQVLRPDILSPHVGTAYGSSIINTRHGIFFFGPDGFYQIKGLSEPQKLSTQGIDGEILTSLFANQPALTAEQEDSQMVGFSVPGLPLIGWFYRIDWLLPGNDKLLLYNPVSGAWSSGVGTAFDQWGLAGEAPISAVLSLPYGTDQFNAVLALGYDQFGAYSRLAPLSVLPRQPLIQLRFRPAGSDMPHLQQKLVRGVLPVFSKTSVSAAALGESVTVEVLLDSHNDVWKTESRLASTRNPVSGFYPFEAAGRYFRITISWPPESLTFTDDFSNFEGLFVDLEDLR